VVHGLVVRGVVWVRVRLGCRGWSASRACVNTTVSDIASKKAAVIVIVGATLIGASIGRWSRLGVSRSFLSRLGLRVGVGVIAIVRVRVRVLAVVIVGVGVFTMSVTTGHQ